jgi:uncharacterized protein
VLPPDRLAAIEAVLDRAAGLDALWLFGSEARGDARPDSDVDLAVLFARTPSPEATLHARAVIADIVGRPVDLVDLERASAVLAMQVLRHGTLVVERDRRHRVRFASALPGRYEDVILFRRPAERILRARLAHGRA